MGDLLTFQKNKTKLLISYIISVLSFIFFLWYMDTSDNLKIVENYISVHKLFIMGILCITAFFAITYVVNKYCNISWYEQMFYGGMISFLFVFLLIGYITHGKSIINILANDPNNALMDFYNSIQYGFKPYSQKVIYPPLINVVYGFLGRYLPDKSNTYILRSTQMGTLVFGTYIIFVYSSLIFTFNKFLNGNFYKKMLFSFIILTSLPFLFAYERANSIVPTLVFMLIFLFGYQSTSKNMRIFSYIALGIAAGIKIVPAIFGILLVREKQYKEACIAALIGIFIFLAPFMLSDGNPKVLIKNMNYATSLYHGVYPAGSKMLINGNGLYVNLKNTFDFLGRLLNINFNNLALCLREMFLICGLGIVLLVKKIQEWKIIGILTGIIILYPSFSGIYCLIYMVIPLIYFLNSQPTLNFSNGLYLLLVMAIFMPGVNFKIKLFRIFFEDWHPLTFMTATESICLMFIMLMLLADGCRTVYNEKSDKLSLRKKGLAFLSMIFIISGLYFWKVGFSYRSVDSFHPYDLSVVNASSGFVLENGFYGRMDNNALIYLNSTKISENGLAVCYDALSKQDMKNNEVIKLFINDKLLKTKSIISNSKGLMYITPEQVKKVSASNNNLCLKISKKNPSDMVKVSYIGPAKGLQFVNQGVFIEEATAGLFRNEHDGTLWLSGQANILMDYKSVNRDGLKITGIVPNCWRQANAGKVPKLTITSEKGTIQKILPIAEEFDFRIPVEQICDNKEENFHKPVYIQLAVNGTFNTKVMGVDNEDFPKGISIFNIGPSGLLPGLNIITDDKETETKNEMDKPLPKPTFKECSKGFLQNEGRFWLGKQGKIRLEAKNYVNTGLYISYSATPELFIFNDKNVPELKVYINDKLVSRETVKRHNLYTGTLGGIFIPSSALENCGRSIDLKLEPNVTFNLHGNKSLTDSQVSVLINYIGYDGFPNSIDSKINMQAFTSNVNLNEREKSLTIGKWGEFLLAPSDFLAQGLIVKYNVSPLLFQANIGENISFDMYVNGHKIKTVQILKDGENKAIIDANELRPFIGEKDNSMVLKIVSSNVYNEKAMHIRNYSVDTSLKILSIEPKLL